MRQPRLRVDSGITEGTYYHIYNHAIGSREDRPFEDAEKEKLVELILKLNSALSLDVLGFCVMGNHYHVVLYAPHKRRSDEDAIRGWGELYGAKPPPWTPDGLADWAERCRDISEFGFQLHSRFTCWYNRTRLLKRKGTIWDSRFKSTILEGSDKDSAVWACLKYIELNPVRAQMQKDPADYRWSSWGRYSGAGIHPFAGAFCRHLTRLKGCIGESWTPEQVYSEFRYELARVLKNDAERQAQKDALAALPPTSKIAQQLAELDLCNENDPSIRVRTDRRVRFWAQKAAVPVLWVPRFLLV